MDAQKAILAVVLQDMMRLALVNMGMMRQALVNTSMVSMDQGMKSKSVLLSILVAIICVLWMNLTAIKGAHLMRNVVGFFIHILGTSLQKRCHPAIQAFAASFVVQPPHQAVMVRL